MSSKEKDFMDLYKKLLHHSLKSCIMNIRYQKGSVVGLEAELRTTNEAAVQWGIRHTVFRCFVIAVKSQGLFKWGVCGLYPKEYQNSLSR